MREHQRPGEENNVKQEKRLHGEETSALPVTGLVLAGGRATRMGGIDKGLLPLAGRPLVDHVLERLRPQVTEMLIVANRHREAYSTYGFPVLTDQVGEYWGPLAGILTGLQGSSQPWLAVVPCDSPIFPLDLVQRLYAAATQAQQSLAVAHDGQRLQSVFTLIHRTRLPMLQDHILRGGRRLEAWYASESALHVDFSDVAEAFVNLNTLEESARLEQQWNRRVTGTGSLDPTRTNDHGQMIVDK
jgi:molybdenum cofactor guanylyltransferase